MFKNTIINYYTNMTDNFEKFNFFDSKGRQIGYKITRFECDVVDWDNSNSYTTRAKGHYYIAVVQTTRNGIKYGTGQPHEHFTNPEDREKYIQKRISTSRVALEKKHLKYI